MQPLGGERSYALRAVSTGEKGDSLASLRRARERLALPHRLVARLRRMLDDPAVHVRAEACAWLADAGVCLGWAELMPSILGGPPLLRSVALRAALVGRDPAPATIIHLLALVSSTERHEPRLHGQAPDLPWVSALERHDSEARAFLLQALQARCGTWTGLLGIATAYTDVAAAPIVEEVLGLRGYSSSWRGTPASLVRRALPV